MQTYKLLISITLLSVCIVCSLETQEINAYENEENVMPSKRKRPIDNNLKIKHAESIPSSTIMDGESYDGTEAFTFSNWPKDAPDSLVIPEGIEYLGSKALRFYPSYLKSIYFPKSLRLIGPNALWPHKIKEIKLPDNPRLIVARHAFQDNDSLENLNLSKSAIIGAYAFANCSNLKWVEIPAETGIIEDNAFVGCPISYLKLLPQDSLPFYDFAKVFGKTDIPFIACRAEMLNIGIRSRYQTYMPEVFKDRAMIHLTDRSLPAWFSFDHTGEKEERWVPRIDLWPLLEKGDEKEIITKKDSSGYIPFKYPVHIRIDLSSLNKKQLKRLRVTYNGTDITKTVKNGKFTLSYGYPFYWTEEVRIYNRLKITIEE